MLELGNLVFFEKSCVIFTSSYVGKSDAVSLLLEALFKGILEPPFRSDSYSAAMEAFASLLLLI